RNVSLSFNKDEKAVITGVNGSGKSTLARLALGLLKPQRGRVLLDGKPVSKYSLAEVGAKIGYLGQYPARMLFTLNPYDEIAWGLRLRRMSPDEIHALCCEYLNLFGLWHIKDRNNFTLSEGQQQLVALSAVLALKPSMLLLDEPTKSIDALRKRKLVGLLNRLSGQGAGLIVISHDRELAAALGGREIRMLKGEVVKDEP
ncbi:MAG TPA: ABC transporter ATP-binding protein, partial [Firmicutes bacterium]|nr:ABC transporter ATP-binding protein [Bacillota bacterium]